MTDSKAQLDIKSNQKMEPESPLLKEKPKEKVRKKKERRSRFDPPVRRTNNSKHVVFNITSTTSISNYISFRYKIFSRQESCQGLQMEDDR